MMKLMVLGMVMGTLLGDPTEMTNQIETTNEIVTEVKVEEEEVCIRELLDGYLNYDSQVIDGLYGYYLKGRDYYKIEAEERAELEVLGLSESEINYVLLDRWFDIDVIYVE